MTARLTLTPTLARHLAVHQQRLAGPRAAADADGLLDVVRSLGCLQLDPLSVVARTHMLVLFSRVGPFDLAHLDQLLWQDRSLFEYWAHWASIVLTEDYPIFAALMMDHRPWTDRTRKWVKQNERLRRSVLAQIRRRGPILSRNLEDAALPRRSRASDGWSSGRTVSHMLDYLWLRGTIMVAGRDGIQKRWDLAERCLPEWTPKERLSPREAERRAVLRSVRALGVATARHIRYHFLRGSYPNLPRALAELEREGDVRRVEIRDGGERWPGTWFMASEAIPALEAVRQDWQPTTTLLSPFDNLICDRTRTGVMFDFDYRVEIYVPRARRKWGYYVLPILHGDRLIGRIDPEMDRVERVLRVNAVFAEAGAPAAGVPVRKAIESLALFLGARQIQYNRRRVPAAWKRALLA